MKKLTTVRLFVFGVAAALALLVVCFPAEGQIYNYQVDFEGHENSSIEYPTFADPVNSTVTMYQETTALGPSTTDITVEMFGDSTFSVTKYVTNNTDIAWSGYTFALEGENVSLVGKPDSNFFSDVDFDIDTNTFTYFRQDASVQPGENAAFRFFIKASNPEPSSIVLFGLGALIAKRRRRKNSPLSRPSK